MNLVELLKEFDKRHPHDATPHHLITISRKEAHDELTRAHELGVAEERARIRKLIGKMTPDDVVQWLIDEKVCTCASFFTVRGEHKKDCPLEKST